MAFEPKQAEIRQALDLENTSKGSVGNVPYATQHETKKQYQLMFKPSVRKKLDDEASARGYRSASAFLEDLINNL